MTTTTEHRRMSATERLEQLRDFVATHERPPLPPDRRARREVAGRAEFLARRRGALKVKKETMMNKDGVMPSNEESVSRHNERMQSTRTNAVKQNAMVTVEDPKVSTPVDIDAIRSLGVDEEPDCVLHPAESETFQRSVLERCSKESEALAQVATIWMELIPQGTPPSECIVEICEQLPDLSPFAVRRRIHRIRALAVDMLESHLNFTAADV